MRTGIIGYSYNKEIRSVDKKNLLQYISPADLRKFGLIPEIVGRMPVITYLHPLNKKSLRRILTEPNNSLVKQYKVLFEMDGIKLSFDEKVLDFIVDKATEFRLGARGLRSIIEGILTDAMFELPSQTSIKSFHVNHEYAEKKFNKTSIAKLKVA